MIGVDLALKTVEVGRCLSAELAKVLPKHSRILLQTLDLRLHSGDPCLTAWLRRVWLLRRLRAVHALPTVGDRVFTKGAFAQVQNIGLRLGRLEHRPLLLLRELSRIADLVPGLPGRLRKPLQRRTLEAVRVPVDDDRRQGRPAAPAGNAQNLGELANQLVAHPRYPLALGIGDVRIADQPASARGGDDGPVGDLDVESVAHVGVLRGLAVRLVVNRIPPRKRDPRFFCRSADSPPARTAQGRSGGRSARWGREARPRQRSVG